MSSITVAKPSNWRVGFLMVNSAQAIDGMRKPGQKRFTAQLLKYVPGNATVAEKAVTTNRQEKG
jgi:hypothetical protein